MTRAGVRRGALTLLFTMLALGVACACDKDKPSGDRAAASAALSPSAVAAPSAAAAAPAKPVGPELTEPAVRELVQKWTAAQSNNDFAGYQALYADRFTGIKRAGTFTKKLGREAWMADRKTMIAPGLVVEASDVKVDLTPNAANVHLVQRYKSPRFEDVGPKQLVVVLSPAGPRIAREEMLASTIQMQGLGKSLASRLHAAESTGVFIAAGLPKEATRAPALGKTEYLKGVEEAGGPANDAALTAEQKAFVGRAFTAYDEAGKPCPAVVKRLSVRALVFPHFGVRQSFDDREEYPDPAVAAKAKPGVYYDLAGEGGRYLFGVFESPCAGARWAVEGSPIAVVGKSESPKTHPAALTALRGLAEYKKIQAELGTAQPDKKTVPWDTYDDGVTAFNVFRPEKGPPLLVVGAWGGSGCSDFLGTLAAVFDLTDPAHPVARGALDASPAGGINPIAVVDLDGNGEYEFVTGPDGESERFGLVRAGPKGTFVREDFFAVPYLDCPC